MHYDRTLHDRLRVARKVAEGKRVLDIGGALMPAHSSTGVASGLLEGFLRLIGVVTADPADSGFYRAYCAIAKSAHEYRIMDCHDIPPGHYEANFNEKESVEKLRAALDAYRPEVILCMETLEHVNYRFEMMNEMARAAKEFGSTVFISIPNNDNWVFNALGWNYDHSVAFLRGIAERFVTRSDLGQHAIVMFPCFQQYVAFWWIVYALSFFRPMCWGFLITPVAAAMPASR